MAGRCTFKTTFVPSFSCAGCTCAMEAEPSGVCSMEEKMSETEEARKEQPEDPDITSDERTPEESE